MKDEATRKKKSTGFYECDDVFNDGFHYLRCLKIHKKKEVIKTTTNFKRVYCSLKLRLCDTRKATTWVDIFHCP